MEPFLPHTQTEEAYVCIYSKRDKDVVLFCHEGGVDIGDVDSKASVLEVPIQDTMEISTESIINKLLTKFQGDKNLVAR